MPTSKRFRSRKRGHPAPKSKRVLFRGVLAIVVVAVSSVGFLWYRHSLRTAEIRIGDCSLKVEIADTPDLWEKGLSGRKRLADGQGMLFIFDFQRRYSFWMKDTSIPLSIAFISAEGQILQIEQMAPFDSQPVASHSPVKYALEVNRGFFQENGIQIGMSVDLKNLNTK